jgi:hypothetical protein
VTFANGYVPALLLGAFVVLVVVLLLRELAIRRKNPTVR